VIVRCRVCKELILPPAGIIGGDSPAFLGLVSTCTRHSVERHPELFAQISAVAGQVVASLTLELFETQQAELAQCSAGLRRLAVNAVHQARYSELKGIFELSEPEANSDTVTGNVTLLAPKDELSG